MISKSHLFFCCARNKARDTEKPTIFQAVEGELENLKSQQENGSNQGLMYLRKCEDLLDPCRSRKSKSFNGKIFKIVPVTALPPNCIISSYGRYPERNYGAVWRMILVNWLFAPKKISGAILLKI